MQGHLVIFLLQNSERQFISENLFLTYFESLLSELSFNISMVVTIFHLWKFEKNFLGIIRM